MNGFARAPWRIVESYLFWLGLILIGGGCLGLDRVEAAPIRHDHESHETNDAAQGGSGRFSSWSEYLMAGPSVWSHIVHPRVTAAVEHAIWKAIRTDPGESSPWVHYLLWKQNLDSARFDHNHPKLSVALDRLSAPATGAQVLNPTPGTTSTGGSSAPPLTQAQEIPEPATWLLALGMAGWGAWWRRRRI